jgi:hypothetical protein
MLANLAGAIAGLILYRFMERRWKVYPVKL